MSESIDVVKEQWLRRFLTEKAALKLDTFPTKLSVTTPHEEQKYIEVNVQATIKELLEEDQRIFLLKTCRAFVHKGYVFNPGFYPHMLHYMIQRDFYNTLFIQLMPELPLLESQEHWWNLLSEEGFALRQIFNCIWSNDVSKLYPKSSLSVGQLKLVLNHFDGLHVDLSKQLAEKYISNVDLQLSKCALQFLTYKDKTYKSQFNEWMEVLLSSWSVEPPDWLGDSTYWQHRAPWVAITELMPLVSIDIWPAHLKENFGRAFPIGESKQRDVAFAFSQSLVYNQAEDTARQILELHGLAIPDYMLGNILKAIDRQTYNDFLQSELLNNSPAEVLLWTDKSQQTIRSHNSEILVAWAINELLDFRSSFSKIEFRKSFLQLAWRLDLKQLQHLNHIPIEDFRYEKNTFRFLQALYRILEQRTIVHNSLHTYV